LNNKKEALENEEKLRQENKENYYYFMPLEEFETIRSNRTKEKDFNLVYGFLSVYGGKYITKNVNNGIKALLKGAKEGYEPSITILKNIIEEDEIKNKLLEKETEWLLSQK